jgi:hypothetical protein
MDSDHSGQIKFRENYNGFEILIPSKRNWFLVIGFSLFILIWFVVEIFVLLSFILYRSNNSFPFIWICGWTAAGLFAIRMWIWHTLGKTMISIQSSQLIIWRQNDIFSKQKQFDLGKIRNLHIQNRDVEKSAYYVRPNYLFTDETKTIAFEYENRTIRAVDWLNGTDANWVVSKLQPSIPI